MAPSNAASQTSVAKQMHHLECVNVKLRMSEQAYQKRAKENRRNRTEPANKDQ
jgi:hypothetical protein